MPIEDFLKTVEFFSGLTDAELQELASLTLRKAHPKGAYIHAEGQKNDKLHIVESGLVEVVKVQGAKQVSLGKIGPKGFYGEMSMFIPPTITATVQAEQESVVLSFPHDALRKFIQTNPAAGNKILMEMMRVVCTRLDQVNDRYGATMFWLSEKIYT